MNINLFRDFMYAARLILLCTARSQIISVHGFTKLHRFTKRRIMEHLVGQVDLQPPRRSTLHTAARLSAASVVAAQAVADVAAIGWTECPIGSVAGFAGFGEDPPEPLEPMPRPADHVLSLAVRRARSKRTRGSAYPRRAASEKGKVKDEEEEEKGEIWRPPPSTPPLRVRSPTPPPSAPSSPRPQTMVPAPPSSPCRRQPKLEPILSSPPPPGIDSPPPPGSGSPPPPDSSSSLPPRWSRPTLAPLSAPPARFVSPLLPTPPVGFGSSQVPPPPGPGAPPTFKHHLQPAGPRPLWRPTVPLSNPAPCPGAPSVLPRQQAPWRWPLAPPRRAPPHMQHYQRPPPPWGWMRRSAPPPVPPQHPPRFEEQQHTPQPRQVIYF
ncbi:uncharacterized protein [Lolium perenne]|uniref:uncharacterized protein n=1 Tax=Lolium perenne TaxID=4522 RepID=UPI0021F50912|nr:leucine-rich repeat extensin-like protein 3 [Lolium perenne]